MKNSAIAPLFTAVASLALLMVGCGDRATTTTATAAPVEAALNVACPGLLAHAADVVRSPAVKKPSDMTTQREQGWTEVHQVVVQVSEKPSRRVASDMKATGNHCYFDIGPDLSTVAVSKRACMALCKNQSFDQIQGTPYLAYFGADGSVRYMR